MRPHECISVLDRVKKLFECMKNRRINDARCMCEYNVRYKPKAQSSICCFSIVISVLRYLHNNNNNFEFQFYKNTVYFCIVILTI